LKAIPLAVKGFCFLANVSLQKTVGDPIFSPENSDGFAILRRVRGARAWFSCRVKREAGETQQSIPALPPQR
jgi:hypothetical protein